MRSPKDENSLGFEYESVGEEQDIEETCEPNELGRPFLFGHETSFLSLFM